VHRPCHGNVRILSTAIGILAGHHIIPYPHTLVITRLHLDQVQSLNLLNPLRNALRSRDLVAQTPRIPFSATRAPRQWRRQLPIALRLQIPQGLQCGRDPQRPFTVAESQMFTHIFCQTRARFALVFGQPVGYQGHVFRSGESLFDTGCCFHDPGFTTKRRLCTVFSAGGRCRA